MDHQQTFASFEKAANSWIAVSETVAACTYRFRSQGLVGGDPFSATGRGTNVLVKSEGSWTIVHEHLSREPTA